MRSGISVRGHQTTTYTAGFESPPEYVIGLRREALRREMGSLPKVVLLVDAALDSEKNGIRLLSPKPFRSWTISTA